MKTWLPPILAGLFVFGVLSPVLGNAPPLPRPAPLPAAQSAKVVVQIDERVTEPRLVIPRSMMGEKKSALLETPTIIAGLALTLAFVSGGVWLVRRGRSRTMAAVVLVMAAIGFGTSVLYADIAPRPRPPVLTNVKLPATLMLKEDKIQIEFVEKGDEIKLLVKQAWVKEDGKTEPKPTTAPPKSEPKPKGEE